MKIKGNRFLITGGAGMIGSHLADRLLAEGAAEIILLDNFTRGCMENIKSALESRRARLVKGDIRNEGLVRDVARNVGGIFHLAALRITACADAPREAMEVMLMGTHNVFQAAVENNVRRVVYASSASVYGLAEEFPTDEKHHAYGNRTYYGVAKIAGEGMARAFAETNGFEYVALRYFNVYGPRMDLHGRYTEVIIRWLDRIEAGQAPVIFGDGSQTLDLIYIDDVTNANILAMESDVSDEVFNIGSGTETSLRGLLRALLRATGSSLEPEFEAERRVNKVSRRLADTRKAERILGFKAGIDIDAGLLRLVAWRKKLQEQVGTDSRNKSFFPFPLQGPRLDETRKLAG